jgi:hypothetical protein
MLDHWEPLDSNIDGNRVVEVVAKAAAGLINESTSMSKVKVEELECWDWEETYGSGSPDWYRQSEHAGGSPHIKQEDVDSDKGLVSGDDTVMSPAGDDEYAAYSPLSPLPGFPSQSSPVLSASVPSMSALRRHSELAWKDVELLGPDSVHPHEFEEGEWQEGSASATIRARSKTQPSLPTFEAARNFSSFLSTHQPEAQNTAASELDDIVQPPDLSSTILAPSTSPTQTLNSPPPRSVVLPSAISSEVHDVVVVHTCQPCTPAISATQVEGGLSII